MKPLIHQQKSLAILHDASLILSPSVDHFCVDYWKSKRALLGEALGRGSAWFIDTSFGPMVLRHYLRGGWAAKLSRQSYFFTTVSRSRPFREYHLLESLYEQGLPVPRPVAALCEFRAFVSTGAILTMRILSARTLADVLPGINAGLDQLPGLWESIGKCIHRFHDAGLWHADLNARNILLDAEGRVFLIDFDRARYTPGRAVNGQGNLKRLKRSLVKLWPTNDLPALALAWTELEAAYDK